MILFRSHFFASHERTSQFPMVPVNKASGELSPNDHAGEALEVSQIFAVNESL